MTVKSDMIHFHCRNESEPHTTQEKKMPIAKKKLPYGADYSYMSFGAGRILTATACGDAVVVRRENNPSRIVVDFAPSRQDQIPVSHADVIKT